MTHKVKSCPSCGTENDPGEVQCYQCQVMLPNTLTDSDRAFPPKPAMRLDLQAEPRPKRQELPKDTFAPPKPEFRKWPYEVVPIRNGAYPLRVTVADLDISFWNLVQLMVKTAFAAIPAILIIFILVTGLLAVLGLLGLPFRGGA